MANGETTRDLIQSVLRSIGELTDGTSPYHADALEYLDEFHKAFHSGATLFDLDFGGEWTWAKERDPQVLILEPAYETGTIDLVQNSASATLSTPPSSSLQDWFLKVEGRAELYRLSSHLTPFAAATLDSVFTGSSGTYNFTIFKVDYDLDQVANQKILRLISPFQVYSDQEELENEPGNVDMMEFAAYKKKWPLKYVRSGIPTACTEIRDDDGAKRVRFNRYPTELTRVEYELIQVPNDLQDSDDSIPRLPREARNTIEYAATFKMMLDADDDRAEKYLQMAQTALAAARAADRRENQSGSTRRGRLIARADLDAVPKRTFW
jgi:hypothetical protein